MKKILKNLLPANLYSKFSIVYHAIKARSLKYLFYNIEKDLKQNEKNFMELGLDKDKIINVLKNHNYDYYNPNIKKLRVKKTNKAKIPLNSLMNLTKLNKILKKL